MDIKFQYGVREGRHRLNDILFWILFLLLLSFLYIQK